MDFKRTDVIQLVENNNHITTDDQKARNHFKEWNDLSQEV